MAMENRMIIPDTNLMNRTMNANNFEGAGKKIMKPVLTIKILFTYFVGEV